MTPAELRSWRIQMRLTQEEAARALGYGRRAYQYLEQGTRPDGKPVTIPRYLGLACSALYHRLSAWDTAEQRTQ